MTIPDGLPPLISRRGGDDEPPELPPIEVEECPAHNPVNHRDRRPHWCDLCGRMADGNPPPESPAVELPPLPPAGTHVVHHRRSDEHGTVLPRLPSTPERAVRVRWDGPNPDDNTGDVPVNQLRVAPARA